MKKLLKSNPFLFKLWYHFYRKNRGVKINYFDSNTNFLFDGYPRSGNTFFVGLCKRVFNSEHFIHHFHTIAPIKIALSKKLPLFILIREPTEAISSYYLKSFALSRKSLPETIDKNLLSIQIRDYFEYYDFVYRNIINIHIVIFEKNIAKPLEIIERINEIVFNSKHKVNYKVIDAYKIEYKGATDTLGSSRPNEVKENLKAEIKKHIIRSKYYKESKEIYDKLTT